MKKAFLSLALLCASLIAAYAQAPLRHALSPIGAAAKTTQTDTVPPIYAYSRITGGTYTNLVNATPLIPADSAWDDSMEGTIPLGFDFPLSQNVTTDELFLYANGMFGAMTQYDPQNGIAIGRFLLGTTLDIIARTDTMGVGQSPISYVTEGAAGSRICKVQYKNAGFYEDTTGIDSVNVQYWFYEADGAWEVHFGARKYAITNFSGLISGFVESYDFANDSLLTGAYLLNGLPIAASLRYYDLSDTTAMPPMVVSIPQSGRGFRYALLNTAAEKPLVAGDIQLFPNPAKESLTLQLPADARALRAQVLTLSGQVLSETQLTDSATPSISLQNIAAGMYLLRISTADGAAQTLRFVKE